MVCATVVLIIVIVTVCEVWNILGAAQIIFVPPHKLDQHVEEQTPLLSAHMATPRRTLGSVMGHMATPRLTSDGAAGAEERADVEA